MVFANYLTNYLANLIRAASVIVDSLRLETRFTARTGPTRALPTETDRRPDQRHLLRRIANA